jgi:hypothetical protein
VLEKVREMANKVSSLLTKAANALPSWKDTTGILASLFKLVDIIVYAFSGNTTDEEIKKALSSLSEIADSALSGMKFVHFHYMTRRVLTIYMSRSIQDALAPLKEFLEQAWEQVKTEVLTKVRLLLLSTL